MPVRIAVTGAAGQLGRALLNSGAPDREFTGAGSAEVDVRDWAAVRAWIATNRPHYVIHAAAMTDVDGCESRADDAYAVNALGTRHVAAASDSVGATVIYVSTNFVFDGESDHPYHEFDCPRPINIYGASKLAGEREAIQSADRVYIVRTAMIFDERGRNFVNTMKDLMTSRASIGVVSDQFGNPTYAPDLAHGIVRLINERPPGVYHLTNSGSTSWYGWASEIARGAGLSCEVRPIDAAAYPRAATPPANGVLTSLAWSTSSEFMPHWTDALARCLA